MAYNRRWSVPKKPEPTIEELAYKFLEGRYLLSVLKQKYGRKTVNKIVSDQANILLMVDPNHERAKAWFERGQTPKKQRRTPWVSKQTI